MFHCNLSAQEILAAAASHSVVVSSVSEVFICVVSHVRPPAAGSVCVCVFIWTPLSAKDFCRLWLWAILTNQILNSLRLAHLAPRSPTLLFVTLIVLFDRCWYKSSMQAIWCVTFLLCLLMLCRVTPGVQPGGHSAAAYVWNAFAINFMRSSFLFKYVFHFNRS